MYERDYQIGRTAFYEMVGGPDAMVPKKDGASVILRLVAAQTREACGVSPLRLDHKSKGIIQSVDRFYGVKRVDHYPTVTKSNEQAHPAQLIFEKSGTPQDILIQLHKDTAQTVAPFEYSGLGGKLVAKIIREVCAARYTPVVVAAKARIMLDLK
jgi:hypothetical protein